jgi:prepilin-type N-terminal cleavage/methylation domain-containing protein
MKKRLKAQHGFSLIEILISLAILGIIAVGVTQLLSSTSAGYRVNFSQTVLQTELRNAAAIIGDEIQRAFYVFPPQGSSIAAGGGSVTVDWSKFTLGNGNTTTGITGSNVFEVPLNPSLSQPPILALITAPRVPSLPCTTDGTTLAQEGAGCYQFVMYYPVIRTRVSRGQLGNSNSSSKLLDYQANNTERWVIMELRVVLTGSQGGAWGNVGCTLRDPSTRCTSNPSGDPSNIFQQSSNSLPSVSCYANACNADDANTLPPLGEVQNFQTRMNATVNWIKDRVQAAGISASIVIDNIDESFANGGPGFRVLMPAETRDVRGVTQVRLRLRGKLTLNSETRTFGAENNSPISFFFVPRNIAPMNPTRNINN